MKRVLILLCLGLSLGINAKTVVLLDSIVTETKNKRTAKEIYEYDEYGREKWDIKYVADTKGDFVPETKVRTIYKDTYTVEWQYLWDASCDCWRTNYSKNVSFNAEGLITSVSTAYYIDTEYEFDSKSSITITYKYNAKKLLTEAITEKGTTLEAPTTLSKKEVYSYNSRDSLEKREEYSYQNKAWVGSNKVENIYKDTLGRYRIILQNMPKWNSTTKDFTTNQAKITYHYNIDESETKTIFAYTLGNWYEGQKEVFYYEDGLLMEYNKYSMDSGTGKLYKSDITDNSYDGRGNLTESYCSVYIDGMGWCKSRKYEYKYDDANNCIEYNSWLGDYEQDVWVQSVHYARTFDVYGNILTHTIFSTQNNDVLAIQNYYYSTFEIQDGGEVTEIDNIYSPVKLDVTSKFIRNGQLFIQRGEEVFNAQGERVK